MRRVTVYLPEQAALAIRETSEAMAGVPEDVVMAAALDQFAQLNFTAKRAMTLDFFYRGLDNDKPAAKKRREGFRGLVARLYRQVRSFVRR